MPQLKVDLCQEYRGRNISMPFVAFQVMLGELFFFQLVMQIECHVSVAVPSFRVTWLYDEMHI